MKNVLITGAGIGIGKATALNFAHSGYNVFVSDILSTEGQQVTEEIASAGGSAQYIHLDVTVNLMNGSTIDTGSLVIVFVQE